MCVCVCVCVCESHTSLSHSLHPLPPFFFNPSLAFFFQAENKNISHGYSFESFPRLPASFSPLPLSVHFQSQQKVKNKPTKIKENIINDLPRPRKVSDPDFVELRNRVTDLIKWW